MNGPNWLIMGLCSMSLTDVNHFILNVLVGAKVPSPMTTVKATVLVMATQSLAMQTQSCKL